jgi:type 1 glutamine amidotransferase
MMPAINPAACMKERLNRVKRNWFITSTLVVVVGLTLVTAVSLLRTGTTAHNPPVTPGASQGNCDNQQAGANASPSAPPCGTRLLVFSKTAAFRHASIKDGKLALQELAREHHYAIDFTEDSTFFTRANLSRYAAVVFLSTTGEVFNPQQESAFKSYIEAGGGFVGIHSASDTLYGWPWYDGLVGAHNNVLDKHSGVTRATIDVTDRSQPSTSMLPPRWIRTDEWYNFAVNPRGRVHVLMSMDERTYIGGTMGADHHIAWYHAYDGGRAWYTALGHTSESYYEPLFLAHLWGGITFAVGAHYHERVTGSSAGAENAQPGARYQPPGTALSSLEGRYKLSTSRLALTAGAGKWQAE